MIAAASPPLTKGVDYEMIFNALPSPAMVFDAGNRFVAVNAAAELFLSQSAVTLRRATLASQYGAGSRLEEIVNQARRGPISLSEYGVEIEGFDREAALVDLQAAQLFDAPGHVLLLVQPRSVAQSMGRSLSSRNSARSLSGLSAMLAHEIKNPLSGISGAAQLLEMTSGDEDAELLKLIHEEVERIRLLVDRMDVFGAGGPSERRPVNIHHVLDQARRSAAAGFARHVRFTENYDPSLPPVPADRTQLLQALSNLIKNAAEAAPRQGGEVWLRTAYRPGVKLSAPGGGQESLPLQVTVLDNGPGVPEELQQQIFEPFVTSKASGNGLGLPLVAKIVGDHGGVIECRREGDRTAFRMLLPVWTGPWPGDDSDIDPFETFATEATR